MHRPRCAAACSTSNGLFTPLGTSPEWMRSPYGRNSRRGCAASCCVIAHPRPCTLQQSRTYHRKRAGNLCRVGGAACYRDAGTGTSAHWDSMGCAPACGPVSQVLVSACSVHDQPRFGTRNCYELYVPQIKYYCVGEVKLINFSYRSLPCFGIFEQSRIALCRLFIVLTVAWFSFKGSCIAPSKTHRMSTAWNSFAHLRSTGLPSLGGFGFELMQFNWTTGIRQSLSMKLFLVDTIYFVIFLTYDIGGRRV